MRNNPTLQGPDGIIDFTNLFTDWNGYCDTMSKDGEWADHVVIVATAHMLQKDLIIVTSSPQSKGNAVCKIRCGVESHGEPLRLGHVWEWHYQSLKLMNRQQQHIELREEENFVRLHLALQMVCSQSIPCITDVIKTWHDNQKQLNMQCMNPQQCIRKGKPRPKKSCSACRAWRNAIESVYYPPANVDRIQWQNIDPTVLHNDVVEVAKAFTFRLPGGKSFTSFGDFDAGSLLAIMFHFNEFHKGDSVIYDAVRKIEDIRNCLSHTNVKENLEFDQKETEEYFQDLDSLVLYIQNLYPKHFTQAIVQDLSGQLNRLQKSPLALFDDNRSLKESIENLYDDIKTNQILTQKENAVLKLQLEQLMQRHTISEPAALDVSQCRKELEHHYRQTLCKIPLIPGDKSNCLNMDDIYTNLSIQVHLPKLSKPLLFPLKSHHEMFTYPMKNGVPAYRILVLGNPGCGKSILTLKLAYDWAVKNPESPLKDISLLFALSMRWMTSETSLEESIFQQLLPKDTKINRASLRHYIDTNQSTCIILFDSYDEYGFGEHFSKKESKVHDILLNDSLRECKILVTSRFWKASDFDDLRDVYTQIEISGFSDINVEEYVLKFFSDDKPAGDKLLKYLVDHNLNPGLANVPLMTLLFCLCWKDSGGKHMPRKIGELYDAIFKVLYRQYVTKKTSGSINLDQLVIQAGCVALSGLWSSEDKHDRIVFSLPDFVDKSSKETVIDGCKIGLLSIEERSTASFMMTLLNDVYKDPQQDSSENVWTNPNSSVTYFHKSCQEKCAGEYLAHVHQAEPTDFESKLQLLNTAKTCMRLELVLRFACGASNDVAVAILQQLLKVFRVEFSMKIHEYYRENLHPNTTKEIQDFIELCLLCYYESSLPVQSETNLQDMFPQGQMLFFGMSPYTSCAIGQYTLQNCVKSIIIKAIPTLDNINNVRGVLESAYAMILEQLKTLPDSTLQKMYQHEMINNDQYAYGKLSETEFCKYFKDWQSSRALSLAQMFDYKADYVTSLESFKLVGVNLSNQMAKFQSFIDQGALSALTTLDLHNSGLTNPQVDDLLSCIKDKLSNLEWLDISRNLPVRMHHLGNRIMNTQIKVLLVHNNGARVEDMTNLIARIPLFGSRMRVLYITGNAIDDESGRVLAKAMPCLYRLERFSFIVYRMTKNTQNKVITALRHLPNLTFLTISGSWFLDDLLKSMSNVVRSSPRLYSINLTSSGIVGQNTYFPDPLPKWARGRSNQTSPIQRSAARAFVASLGSLTNMAMLKLLEIHLHKEDLLALLDTCRRNNCQCLRYSGSYFPEDLDPTEYQFLEIFRQSKPY
ncbi:uncharacterized protein [Amphiura filiformis]|uniref:uncharacterized protein n=1 Tax=Amphiura filiformis TaxID=82378 RepID=UPI003B224BB5